MIVKIVCAGVDTFTKSYKKDEKELIVAVDGGYDAISSLNIKPDFYFGDHDSVKLEVKSNLTYNYNSIKDDSDFDLAISFLIDQRVIGIIDEIIVYNATGGRLDHYNAIINTLIKYKDYNINIVDDNNKIFVLNKDKVFNKNEYKYISFFSLDDDTIISLENFKYDIKNYNLKRLNNLCLSNEIKKDSKITTNKDILVFMSNSL